MEAGIAGKPETEVRVLTEKDYGDSKYQPSKRGHGDIEAHAGLVGTYRRVRRVNYSDIRSSHRRRDRYLFSLLQHRIVQLAIRVDLTFQCIVADRSASLVRNHGNLLRIFSGQNILASQRRRVVV